MVEFKSAQAGFHGRLFMFRWKFGIYEGFMKSHICFCLWTLLVLLETYCRAHDYDWNDWIGSSLGKWFIFLQDKAHFLETTFLGNGSS